MAEVYGVGTDGRADYTTLADIPSNLLNREGVVFELYAGEHEAPNGAWNTTSTFVGLGSRDEVVIVANKAKLANVDGVTTSAAALALRETVAQDNAVISISNSTSGTVTFENLTIRGIVNTSNSDGHTGITKEGSSKDAVITLRNVVVANVDVGVRYEGINEAASQANCVNIIDSTILDVQTSAVLVNAPAYIATSRTGLVSNTNPAAAVGTNGPSTQTITKFASSMSGVKMSNTAIAIS